MNAIITIGISGSGKTTWAEKFCAESGFVNVNRDAVRFSTALGGAKNWSQYKFSGENEKRVTEICDNMITNAAKDGKGIVVSDTNLHPQYRKNLENKLRGLGYTVEFKEFDITWEEACKRDSLRENGVGRDVLYKQWVQWLAYKGRKVYIPDQRKPKAVIFDVDGTLAQKSDRSPFDWARVGEDSVREHVKVMYQGFKAAEYGIIVLSGRDSVCRPETEKWLHDNGFEFNLLLMRAENDCRKDSLIKEELFWTFANEFCIMCVVDDRPQVIRMWEDLGLNVVNVGNSRLEF